MKTFHLRFIKSGNEIVVGKSKANATDGVMYNRTVSILRPYDVDKMKVKAWGCTVGFQLPENNNGTVKII